MRFEGMVLGMVKNNVKTNFSTQARATCGDLLTLVLRGIDLI